MKYLMTTFKYFVMEGAQEDPFFEIYATEE
jgi:hypothetical protein